MSDDLPTIEEDTVAIIPGPAKPSPERQIMHQYTFSVTAEDEAGLDEEIGRKLDKMNNRHDWTLVGKNMFEEETMVGERTIKVLTAECIAVRVAGYVPWEIPQAIPAQDEHAH